MFIGWGVVDSTIDNMVERMRSTDAAVAELRALRANTNTNTSTNTNTGKSGAVTAVAGGAQAQHSTNAFNHYHGTAPGACTTSVFLLRPCDACLKKQPESCNTV